MTAQASARHLSPDEERMVHSAFHGGPLTDLVSEVRMLDGDSSTPVTRADMVRLEEGSASNPKKDKAMYLNDEVRHTLASSTHVPATACYPPNGLSYVQGLTMYVCYVSGRITRSYFLVTLGCIRTQYYVCGAGWGGGGGGGCVLFVIYARHGAPALSQLVNSYVGLIREEQKTQAELGRGESCSRQTLP